MNELRESIWDLVYGLLSEEESQALIARIKSEPDVARMYAEVRLEADLVAQAARGHGSSIVLNPNQSVDSAASSVSPASAASASPATASHLRLHRIGTWLAGAA